MYALPACTLSNSSPAIVGSLTAHWRWLFSGSSVLGSYGMTAMTVPNAAEVRIRTSPLASGKKSYQIVLPSLTPLQPVSSAGPPCEGGLKMSD